jgi:thiol:disulfide interchange protein
MTLATILIPLIAFLQPATPKVDARLVAAQDAIAPGGAVDIALQLDIEDDWHAYHPIVLDTGAGLAVDFDVPPGVTVGPLRYPTPHAGIEAELRYLALDGEFSLLTSLQLDPDYAEDSVTIRAKVFAIVCKKLCLPVEKTVTLTIPVRSNPQPIYEERFEAARGALSYPLADAPYLKGSSVRIQPDTLRVGAQGKLIVQLKVQAGHHIQDRDPGNPDLIPTHVYVESIDGLKFDNQQWPAAHERNMPMFGKVREHRGTFEIVVPFTLEDPAFAPGEVPLRVLVTYQTCTDQGSCYPPEAAAAVATFTADTDNAPLDPGVSHGTWRPRVNFTDVAPAGAPTESVDTDTDDNDAVDTTSFAVPQLTAEDWDGHIPWQKWQPGYAAWLSEQGYMAYVDYTASWCLTCQANKRAVLETDLIRSKMRDMGVIPIKADFTNRDPQMQAELARYRPTVPVNVIYPPNEPDRIALLPVVLTQGIVTDALDHPEKYLFGAATRQNLALVLLAGFLGGLILNIMPCVLPVISIKVLSFVQQAGEDPGRVFRLGLAFCAGIMVWFWAFGFLSTQGSLPWQYPEVVIALSAILFVFSLNLFGVFELALPGSAAGQLDALASKEGYGGAFMKGLLATLLGTACTAPFLAGAMAYALTQPAWIVYLVFSAAGLGMAAPYLVLSAKPGWLKFIPKPGMWMVTFKQATGFVLLGTVIWLLWILADQLDGKGVVWTVAFLGFLGLASWMLGKAKHNWSTGSHASLWAASVAVVLLGAWFCYFVMYDLRGVTGSGEPPPAGDESALVAEAPVGA